MAVCKLRRLEQECHRLHTEAPRWTCSACAYHGVVLWMVGEDGRLFAGDGRAGRQVDTVIKGSSMRSRQGVSSAGKKTKDGAVTWGPRRTPPGRLGTFQPQ